MTSLLVIFKNLQGEGKRKWSIHPLDTTIAMSYVYSKNIRHFRPHFDLNQRGQP